jgi:hypothetical protein
MCGLLAAFMVEVFALFLRHCQVYCTHTLFLSGKLKRGPDVELQNAAE